MIVKSRGSAESMGWKADAVVILKAYVTVESSRADGSLSLQRFEKDCSRRGMPASCRKFTALLHDNCSYTPQLLLLPWEC